MNSRASWSNFFSTDGDDVLGTVNRLLPPAVSLLLVVLIGWQVGRMVWMLVPGSAAGDAIVTPAAAIPARQSSPGAVDVNAIAAAHLFGEADAADAVAAVEEPILDDLPDTRASLVLKGTVASRQDDFSVAVISSSGAEDKVYAIGDSVTQSVTLHAVYADRVVLNESGALTNLKLPREFSAQAATPVRRQVTAARQTNASIQSVVTQNLTKLTDVIRPTPYMVQGKPAGYRVYPGRNREQFAALGLRPGDIIKDIDGQSLTDPKRAMQIFQSLGTAEQVTVTVERNGQSETLVLSTNQLDLGGEQ